MRLSLIRLNYAGIAASAAGGPVCYIASALAAYSAGQGSKLSLICH